MFVCWSLFEVCCLMFGVCRVVVSFVVFARCAFYVVPCLLCVGCCMLRVVSCLCCCVLRVACFVLCAFL